ncbi:MAG: chromate efflux transporter [Solirubrobacteraceae bacterium]
MAGGQGERVATPTASLATIAREWTRIGVTGFGGPPAHIALLRQLVVERRSWMDARAFEDAIAATNLLPGPASTQLAIFCAYRVGGPAGAVIGGLGFVAPAVVMVLALSVLFLAQSPPLWVRGAGAGAGAAVAAVAVRAGVDLLKPSYRQAHARRGLRVRWFAYLAIGGAAAALVGPYLVLVLLACGLVELTFQRPPLRIPIGRSKGPGVLIPAVIAKGSAGALAWTAFKVGALAFGGGFVIIPLMQGDAVHTYHWMTNGEFLNAVALGQVTPGPVVATVAAVGYAALGIPGGLLAAAVAFAPSFSFVLVGGRRFEQLRRNKAARAFLEGAGPGAIGAILGAAIPLTRDLTQAWQGGVLAAAAVALLLVRRGIVETLLGAGLIGVIVVLAGAPAR